MGQLHLSSDQSQSSFKLKKESLIMKSIFVFLAFLAMATATAIKPENFKNSQNAEERFFVSSGGSNYLTLNSTLIFGTVIALGVMIGLVVALHSAVSSARAQKKHDKNYEETTFTDQSDYAHTRYRRLSNNGIASKMAQLEQAFKKYQVEEAECEMYIACEA